MFLYKNKFLFLLSFFLLSVNLFSLPQNYIGIVRPQFDENDLIFREDAEKEYHKNDVQKKDEKSDAVNDAESDEEKADDENSEETEAEEYESEYNKMLNNYGYDKKIIGSVFGSGFVYVSKNGTNYVITNYHVIENYRYACFEIIDPITGKKELYEDLKVVAIHNDIDLALLEFPSGQQPFKESFPIKTEKMLEEQIVYSAGYPVLNDEPAWQFAKGNVSNATYYNKNLQIPESSYVIQHTAPIDSGNSGGPLLVDDKSSSLGYSVVGVNTWKANSRTLTAYSIPSETIISFLYSYFESEPSEEMLKERAEEFALNLYKKTRTDDDILKFISLNLLQTLSYEDLVNYGKIFNKTFLLNISSYRNFYYGINPSRKKLISFIIWNKYKTYENRKDKDVPTLEIKEIIKHDDYNYLVVFVDTKNENEIETTWIKDMNIWVVSDASYTKSSKKYEKENEYSINGKNKIDWKKVFRFTDPGLYFSFGFDNTKFAEGNLNNYKGLNFNVRVLFPYTWFIEMGTKWQLLDYDNLNLLSLGTGFQFNIYLSKLSISPFVNLDGQICFISEEPVYGFNFGGGVSINYAVEKNVSLGILCSYNKYYLYHFNKNICDIKFRTINTALSVAITLM